MKGESLLPPLLRKQLSFKNSDVSEGNSGFAVSLWLYKKMYYELEKLCKNYEISRSEFVREAIARLIEEVKDDNKR